MPEVREADPYRVDTGLGELTWVLVILCEKIPACQIHSVRKRLAEEGRFAISSGGPQNLDLPFQVCLQMLMEAGTANGARPTLRRQELRGKGNVEGLHYLHASWDHFGGRLSEVRRYE